MIEYPVGMSGQRIVFTDEVLKHFRQHRQLRKKQPEAGGQLFARFDPPQVIVVEATGPRRTDKRTRTSYTPDRAAEQLEIRERFKRGLHYVGDWHTHPELNPRPSGLDSSSISDCCARSSHVLNGFLLVIVGTSEDVEGMCVQLFDAATAFPLIPTTEGAQLRTFDPSVGCCPEKNQP
jgi:integrative and conjugative element protein (TIGR02256 family)